MKILLSIFLGGGLGACARYATVQWITRALPDNKLPLGILTSNLLGCFAIGLLTGYLTRDGAPSAPVWASFAITGFLGSYTTFSTFAMDSCNLWRNGEFPAAMANLAVSVVLGLALAAA